MKTNDKGLLGRPIPPAMARKGTPCYVHQHRPATRVLTVPCAADGQHPVCDECATEDGVKTVFRKYQAEHGDRIEKFKRLNLRELEGPGGKAVRVDMDVVAELFYADIPGAKEKSAANIAAWVVYAPWANPMWHSYHISCINLRPLPNMAPPHIYRKGATHEFWIWALHPGAPPGAVGFPLPILNPMNFAAQLVGTDEEAVAAIEAAVVDILDGKLSPDTDYTMQWIARFGGHMVKEGAQPGRTELVVMTAEGPHRLVMEAKSPNALPTCCHGVKATVRCPDCVEMWRRTWGYQGV